MRLAVRFNPPVHKYVSWNFHNCEHKYPAITLNLAKCKQVMLMGLFFLFFSHDLVLQLKH